VRARARVKVWVEVRVRRKAFVEHHGWTLSVSGGMYLVMDGHLLRLSIIPEMVYISLLVIQQFS
jgi:hypothetical protein